MTARRTTAEILDDIVYMFNKYPYDMFTKSQLSKATGTNSNIVAEVLSSLVKMEFVEKKNKKYMKHHDRLALRIKDIRTTICEMTGERNNCLVVYDLVKKQEHKVSFKKFRQWWYAHCYDER